MLDKSNRKIFLRSLSTLVVNSHKETEGYIMPLNLADFNTKYRIKTYEIPDLTKDEIDKVAKNYPIILSLQQNKKYSDLLCVPFYLNLIVSGGFVEENINDENNFRNLIWERIICLKDKCRKYGVSQSDVRKNVERIVFERSRSFVVGVDSDIVDSDILESIEIRRNYC